MSVIVPFYTDKTIFLTGATGFVGKLLLEQLLRKCELKRIYLLIRHKRGVDPKSRMCDLFCDIVFDRLKKEKPNFHEKIVLVPGDLVADFLGISDELSTKISEEAEIVIHGGATVRFDESIKTATRINVKGTISVLEFCQQIKKLQAFVYISTIFSNLIHDQIEERFYDSPMTGDELIKIMEKLDEDDLNTFSSIILQGWPNTYTYTKCVAENAIKKYIKDLPVVIIRPSVVTSTLSEPVPGWIDNTYSAVGITTGIALGMIKILYIAREATAEIVPGDMLAACILVATHKRCLSRCNTNVLIYNFVAYHDNKLTWYQYNYFISKVIETYPPYSMILPSSAYFTHNYKFMYEVAAFFLHLLPAVFIDIILILRNKDRSGLKMYKKVKKLTELIYDVLKVRCTWNICDRNTRDLWNTLNHEDKVLFNFDMKAMDWPNYTKVINGGLKLYIFKESPENLKAAIKKYRWLKIIQNIIFTLVFGFVIYLFCL